MKIKEEIIPTYTRVINEVKATSFVCECCGNAFNNKPRCEQHEKECFALKEFRKTKCKFEKGDIVKFKYGEQVMFSRIISIIPRHWGNWFYAITIDKKATFDCIDDYESSGTEDDFEFVMSCAEYEERIKTIEMNFKEKDFFGMKFKSCELNQYTGKINVILEENI